MAIKKILGLIGSIALFVGVFTPIVSVPILGTMNYFQNGKTGGTIILLLAGISFVFTLAEKYKGLWFTGVASLALMLFTYVRYQMKLSEVKSGIKSELPGNSLHGLADLAMQSVQMQWGWALLIAGAVFVLAAAAAK